MVSMARSWAGLEKVDEGLYVGTGRVSGYLVNAGLPKGAGALIRLASPCILERLPKLGTAAVHDDQLTCCAF